MPIFCVKSVKIYTGEKKNYTNMFVGFVTNIRYDLKSPFPHSNCPPNTEFEMSPNTKLEPHHPGTDQMKAAIYSAPGATDHLKLLALQGPLPSLSIH